MVADVRGALTEPQSTDIIRWSGPAVGGPVTLADICWGLAAGLGGGLGAMLLFRGLGRGSMAVVAPITATGAAAIPALFGIITGEAVTVLGVLGILLALAAIVLVSLSGDAEPAVGEPSAAPVREAAGPPTVAPAGEDRSTADAGDQVEPAELGATGVDRTEVLDTTPLAVTPAAVGVGEAEPKPVAAVLTVLPPPVQRAVSPPPPPPLAPAVLRSVPPPPLAPAVLRSVPPPPLASAVLRSVPPPPGERPYTAAPVIVPGIAPLAAPAVTDVDVSPSPATRPGEIRMPLRTMRSTVVALTVAALLAAAVAASRPVGALVAGDGLAIGDVASLALALVVVCMASVAAHATRPLFRGEPATTSRRRSEPLSLGSILRQPGVPDALLSGVGFGMFFVFISRAAESAGYWPLVSARAISVVMFVGAALVTSTAILPAQRSRRAVVLAGLLDAAAAVFFVLSTRAGLLSVGAVLASLYPGVTVVLARFVGQERIRRQQLVGLALAAVAVGLLAI